MTLINNLLLLSLYKQFCKKSQAPKKGKIFVYITSIFSFSTLIALYSNVFWSGVLLEYVYHSPSLLLHFFHYLL